ncbi:MULTISPECIES: LysR substrate-binding domain-containing protein [Paraburkholderia]|uniref:LysR substrate-binding domain-containing protein n=1 Tax=Paraburkholderia TaxID=1822464 RepID=UPI0022507864|nr:MULTISPECIES: LysR substrate-binding domain-containing protein [Paraburkholderia]MCX4163619.1 LysR substrate-binding domain-containing protein [Paraburkholderia megapolitana]MDN7159114.1 LysR substrate-binding domain-containing protein [Paraburkholderia sp. CHISQ3]MDQ6496161.1 LysR substrate-binding domain-containing protein [Paraburkholderia megapolitana]
MSNALGRLRDYFEDDLLLQVGKTMVLTPLGESLAKPVRDVLLQVQAITTTRPCFDPLTSNRKIAIEASDYVMNIFLSEVVKVAWEEAPGIQFDLRLVSTNSRENLDSGDIELLLVPDFFNAPDHPSEALFEDTFSSVVWAGNAEVGARISEKQYLAMGHVAVQWGSGQLVSIEEEFMLKHGIKRRREIVAPSFTLLPRLLVGTDRIATLHTRLATSLAEHYPLRVVHCPVQIPRIVETMQWHRYQERDPAISWIRQLFKRVAGSLSSPQEPPPARGRKKR